jgi:hypothetical protein
MRKGEKANVTRSRSIGRAGWTRVATAALCLALAVIALLSARLQDPLADKPRAELPKTRVMAPSRAPSEDAANAAVQASWPRAIAPANCDAPLSMGAAARANESTLRGLRWKPFRRDETGWETYAPLIAAEIGAECPPASAAFAHALARWQSARRLPATGQFTEADFDALQHAWRAKRNVNRKPGTCPPPPSAANLALATPAESYGGKVIALRPRALQAYRDMAAAARAENAEIASNKQMLTIFSAFRSPEYDAMRCKRDGNCDGIRRAVSCSPHQTGLVIDVYLGSAPGFGPDSTAEENRRHQTRGAAYRWMVKNAHRFGFANYPYEPWHWEWTGEAP